MPPLCPERHQLRCRVSRNMLVNGRRKCRGDTAQSVLFSPFQKRQPAHLPKPRPSCVETEHGMPSSSERHALSEGQSPLVRISRSENASRFLAFCAPLIRRNTKEADRTECSVRFFSTIYGGPGRPRTYDNPVMSRGLYQLSYGSSSGKYAPIRPVWQEKKRHIPRKNVL